MILLFFYIAGYAVMKLVLPRAYWSMLFIFPAVGFAFIIWLATLCSLIGFGTDKSLYIIFVLIILLIIIGYKKNLIKEKDYSNICLEEEKDSNLTIDKKKYYHIFEDFLKDHENIILLLILLFGIVISAMPIILNGLLTTFSAGNPDPIIYVSVAKYLMAHGYTVAPTVVQNQPLSVLIYGELTGGQTRPGTFLILSVMSSLFKLDPYQLFSILSAVVYSLIGPLVYYFTFKCINASRIVSIIAALIVMINCNLLWVVYYGFAGQLASYPLYFIILILFMMNLEKEKKLSGVEYIKNNIPLFLILGLTLSAVYSVYAESAFLLLAILFLISVPYLVLGNMKPIIMIICMIFVSFVFAPHLIIPTVKVMMNTVSTRPGWDLPKYALLTEAMGIYPMKLWDKINNIYSIIISVIILYIILIKNQNKIFIVLSVLLPLGFLLIWQGIVEHYSYGYFKSLTIYLPYIVIFFTVGLVEIIINNKVTSNKAGAKYLSYISKAFALACLFMILATGLFTTYNVSKYNLMLDQNIIDLGSINRILPPDQSIYMEAPDIQNYWPQVWAVYFLNGHNLYLNWLFPYDKGIQPSQAPIGNYTVVRLAGAGNDNILSNNIVISGDAIFQNDLYEILHVGEQASIANITWEDDKTDTIYPPEGNYRWINNDAVMKVDISKEGDYVIMCQLSPGPGNPLPYRHLQIFQENNLVDEYYVSKDIDYYELGPLHLQQGVNSIRFHIIEPVNVFKQSNGDTRMLNMMIKNPTFHQFIPYEYGSLIQFSDKGNNAQQYQADGWSIPEALWTWTDGKLATLMMPVKKSDYDLKLEINVPIIIANQKVGVVVNGQKLTDITVNKSGSYEVIIPKVETNNSLLKITFELPDAISPKELRISDDPRTLGIGVQSIIITEIS
jgi:hypothetical protein